MSDLRELRTNQRQSGQVRWLAVRPAKRAPLRELDSIWAEPATGLQDDHYSARRRKRQVTLMQAEHLPVIAGFLGVSQVSPLVLRRNILVESINLLALRERVIAVGAAVLRVTGACHPCSRMEEALGKGGYSAVRGHGGVTAEVIEAGWIRVGDRVELIE